MPACDYGRKARGAESIKSTQEVVDDQSIPAPVLCRHRPRQRRTHLDPMRLDCKPSHRGRKSGARGRNWRGRFGDGNAWNYTSDHSENVRFQRMDGGAFQAMRYSIARTIQSEFAYLKRIPWKDHFNSASGRRKEERRPQIEEIKVTICLGNSKDRNDTGPATDPIKIPPHASPIKCFPATGISFFLDNGCERGQKRRPSG